MKSGKFFSRFLFVVISAVALFSFQVVLTLGLSWRRALQGVGDNLYFSIYVQDAVTDTDLSGILSELEGIPGVKRVDYVDRQSFTEVLKKKHPEIYSDLKTLKNSRIIPRYFRLNMEGSPGKIGIDHLVTRASAIKGVDFVDGNRKRHFLIFEALEKIEDALLILVAGLFTVLSFCFFLGSSMRYQREFEKIRILRDLGAGVWRLRGSFMLEGAILGVMGGMVAATLYRLFGSTITQSVSVMFANQFGKGFGGWEIPGTFEWVIVWVLPPVTGLLAGLTGAFFGFSGRRSAA